MIQLNTKENLKYKVRDNVGIHNVKDNVGDNLQFNLQLNI